MQKTSAGVKHTRTITCAETGAAKLALEGLLPSTRGTANTARAWPTGLCNVSELHTNQVNELTG